MINKTARSGRARVDGVIYRPTLSAMRHYYSRPDVLDEILAAMQRWRVRLEPGEGLGHRWLVTTARADLHETLMRLLDRTARIPGHVKLPYLRIDARRYKPVNSHAQEHLWGCDFIIEKDGANWRPCWDAVLPVVEDLQHWGVRFWLKYTGHHSLHVVIPAECFPRRIGKLPLAPLMPSVTWCLRVFFARRCRQSLGQDGFHTPPGTNMPFTVNEDTGLLNYPLLCNELQDFTPANAAIDRAEIRSFWREVVDDHRNSASDLLRVALHDTGTVRTNSRELDPWLAKVRSTRAQDRREAVLRLPWFSDHQAARQAVMGALADRSKVVRKAAATAMAGIDCAEAVPVLSAALDGAPEDLSRSINSVLEFKQDVELMRRESDL